MITISDKSMMHNGIMIFPDYSNPKQFYYLPPAPELALDPATGRKVFKLLKLAGGLTDPTGGGVQTGGVVLFDCDLRLDDAQIDELKEAIRTQFNIFEEISLSPLLYKDGEVSCYVLGEQTPENEAQTDLGKRANLFVEKLAGAGKPSLYGENRATFSGKISREGVTALEAAFAASGAIGISVVYTLRFDALQPAFNFKVNADWERIYTFLEEKVGLDLIFVNLSSTDIVETLEEAQLITFEEVIYEESASGELNELRKELQSFLLEKYFVPVMSGGDLHNRQIPGMIVDIAKDLVTDSLLLPEFGYSRVELTQEQRKSFVFDLTRVTAKERVIYPQAQLTALVTAEELPEYIVPINTDADMFFRQLDVECLVGGCDFAAHKIAWVHPFIEYGSAPQERADSVLTSQQERMHFTTWVQEGHGFQYKTGYEVAFFPAEANDPHAVYAPFDRLVAPATQRSDRVLAVNPLDLFDQHTIEFSLIDGFPSDAYPVIEVHMLYEDTSGFHCQKSFLLKGGTGERQAAFHARTQKGITGQAQYRLVYHPAEGLPVSKEWEPVEGSYVLVKDPTPKHLAIAVSVADVPANVLWADIHLRYRDPQTPDDFQEELIAFSAEDLARPATMRRVWMVDTSDPTQQMYAYQYTILYTDGTQLSSPDWIESEARTLVVGKLARMNRTILVRPVGAPFADEDLRDIQVTLAQTGANGGTPHQETLVFEDETQVGEFTYQVVGPDQLGYTYEIRYRWQNGLVKRRTGESRAGRLRLDIPTEVV